MAYVLQNKFREILRYTSIKFFSVSNLLYVVPLLTRTPYCYKTTNKCIEEVAVFLLMHFWVYPTMFQQVIAIIRGSTHDPLMMAMTC
jgi:hypothetical protein